MPSSVLANNTLKALEAYGREEGARNMVNKYSTFEPDHIEHEDGRITGTVTTKAGRAMGDFEIGANGRINKMPGLEGGRFLRFCTESPRSEFQAVARVLAAPLNATTGSPSP